MRRTAVALIFAACLGCGSTGSSTPSRGDGPSALAIVLPQNDIELVGGETLVVQLLAVGVDGEPATFSIDGPGFASLEGARLTLAPTRADAGTFTVEISAKAGLRTANATLGVTVAVPNEAPSVWSGDFLFVGDAAGIYGGPDCTLSGHMCCPGPACTLGSDPVVYVMACDADRDPLTIDVQVVPATQALADVVTDSFTGTLDAPQPARCANSISPCACFAVPLAGLAPSTSYAFGVRVRDARGAVVGSATPYSVDDAGWIHAPSLQFRTAP